MKAVILAGGFGTRISEESQVRPKPMVEIGGYPILWHIMKIYSHYGVNDFVICAGYKQHIIKKYFADYALHNSDITFDFQGKESVKVHSNFSEPWKVTVVDTGYACVSRKFSLISAKRSYASVEFGKLSARLAMRCITG